MLIAEYTRQGDTVFDLACGKARPLHVFTPLSMLSLAGRAGGRSPEVAKAGDQPVPFLTLPDLCHPDPREPLRLQLLWERHRDRVGQGCCASVRREPPRVSLAVPLPNHCCRAGMRQTCRHVRAGVIEA